MFDYWQMSFAEYRLTVEGFNLRNSTGEMQHQNQLILLREIFAILYNTNVKRGNRKSSQALLPFSFDKQQESKITEQEIERRLDKLRNEPTNLREYRKWHRKQI